MGAQPNTSGESRVERKRRAARLRIIEAAERLMRERPIDDITVGDITDAADVGHGTFYLHFKSKYEILIPITRVIAQRWDEVIQENTTDIDDPAVLVGVSSRYMGRAVVVDPLWRWMLRHSGVPVDDIRNAIGRFAARDFQQGFTSGRFTATDRRATDRFIVGGFVASLLACLDSENPANDIDQMAELLLRTLGLGIDEAAAIAHQPLPPLATPTGELI